MLLFAELRLILLNITILYYCITKIDLKILLFSKGWIKSYFPPNPWINLTFSLSDRLADAECLEAGCGSIEGTLVVGLGVTLPAVGAVPTLAVVQEQV